MCLREGTEREGAYLLTGRAREQNRADYRVLTSGGDEDRGKWCVREREREKRKMKIGGGRDSSPSWEKDVCSERSDGEASQPAKRIACARRTEQKRVVRRRLVCGAFTGVGPSFILPLQSVNTYLRRIRVCVRVRAHVRVRRVRTYTSVRICIAASLCAYLLTGTLFVDNDEVRRRCRRQR